MKWRDHLRLTRTACEFLRIKEEVANEIVEASIEPDKTPDGFRDRYGRFRPIAHHSPKAVVCAFNYAFTARMAYLNGRNYARPLGRALHYLQDYFTTPPHPRYHDAWEEYLSKIEVNRLYLFEGFRLNEPLTFSPL